MTGDDPHTAECSCVRSRENTYQARWKHIGCRGVCIYVDQPVQNAAFAESAEDDWTVVQLGHTYGCALDSSESVDIPVDLRPEAIINGHTWSKAWYYGDAFVRFVQDILLEFRTCTGYIQ